MSRRLARFAFLVWGSVALAGAGLAVLVWVLMGEGTSSG